MKMLTLLGIFIFSISALAMNGRTTYQAKIVKPDGYPLEASSVNFRFTVLDTVGSCVLYVEDYTAVNMSQSGGLISFALGNGARSFPASGTSQTFQNTFDNSVTSFSCQTPGIYNPLPTDTRRIVMQFNDGNGWQTLPAMTINAVPYAMYANKSNDSKNLNGKADTAFVENSTLAALNCNPATHAITFNGVSFSCIPVGSGGGGVTSVTTSGTVLSTGGTASAPVISIQAATMSQDGYLSSTDWNKFNNKQMATSAAIIATLGYAPADNAALGTLATANSIDLGSASATGIIADARFQNQTNVVSGVQYTKVTVDGKGRVTSGALLLSSDVTTALGYTPANSTSATQWTTNGSNIYYNTGNIGVGVVNPSAKLELASGTASVAPLKFTSGTLLSSAQSGTMEYDGFNFYLTDSTNTRRTIATGSSVGTIDNASNINSSGNITMTPTGSVVVSSTTASTNSNTGALVVKGGLGVAGNINTAGNLNVSGSSVIDGSLKLSSMTSGSVLFAGANGTVTQDNSSLYWDGANRRLGIGTANPTQKLDIDGGSGKGRVFVDVSGSNPAIILAGDATTGYYPVLDLRPLGNSALGGSIMPYSSTGGMLLVGRAGPVEMRSDGAANTVLSVRAATSQTGNLFEIRTSASAVGDLFTVNSSGNVGIGTTTPGAQLDISNSSMSALRLSSTAAGGKIWEFDSEANGVFSVVDRSNSVRRISAASGDYITFYKPDGSTSIMHLTGTGNVGIGTNSPVAKLHVTDSIALGSGGTFDLSVFPANNPGAHNSGTVPTTMSFGGSARVTYNAVRNLANTFNDEFLTFSTHMGGISQGERMRIDPIGNVGIGTSAPGALLQIGENSASGSAFRFVKTTDQSSMRFVSDSSANWIQSGLDFSNNSKKDLNFSSINGVTTWMTLQASTGNVGIGTTLPTAVLHLKAGTTAANTAPLKFTNGTLLTSPESGTVEYDGNNLYFTDSTNTRRTIAATAGSGTYDNASLISNASGNITMYPNGGAGSVIVSAATASTSSNTGAMIVKGGLGVAGSANIAQNLNVSGSSVIDGSLKLSSMTSGSVLFAGTNGVITQDNANFYWDNTNKRLGVGTTTPGAKLDITAGSGTGLNISQTGGGLYTSTAGGIPRLFLGGGNGFGINRQVSSEDIFIGEPGDTGTFRVRGSGGILLGVGASSTTMTIQSNGGNVGIGTTSPVAKLNVGAQTSSVLPDVSTISQLGGTNAGGEVVGLSVVNAAAGAVNNATSINFHNGGDYSSIGGMALITESTAPLSTSLVLRNYNSGVREALRITGAGNVGIGTASPAHKLTLGSGHLAVESGNIYLASGNSLQFNYGVANDYGIYKSGTNLLLTTGGSFSFSGGNVGIGTTAPSTHLDIAGQVQISGVNQTTPPTGLGYGLWAQNSRGLGIYSVAGGANQGMGFWTNVAGTTPTEVMTILRDGNVGIGTSVPYGKLHVTGVGWGDQTVTSDTTSFPTSGTGGLILDGVYTNGTYRTRLVTVDRSANLPLYIQQSKGVANSFSNIARFGDHSQSAMEFEVFGDAAFSGNVGVGTTAPQTALHVAKDITSQNAVSGSSLAWNGNSQIKISSGNNALAFSVIGTVNQRLGIIQAGHSGDGLNYYPDLTDPKLALQPYGGNVGIGTTAPSAKLDVTTSSIAVDTQLAIIQAPGSTAGIGYATIGNGYIGWDYANSGLSVNSHASGGGAGGIFVKAGNVGIGTTAPSYTLHVVGTAGLSTGTAWTNASDIRLKDIQGDYEYGLSEVLQLHTVRYNYKKDNPLGLPSDFSKTGFIAQEVQKIIPDAVHKREDGYLELNVDPIHWAVVNAIKDLYHKWIKDSQNIHTELARQKRDIASAEAHKAESDAKIKKLENENAELKARLEKIEKALSAK